MDNTTALVFNLSTTNLALQARLAKLIQESNQQWFEFACRQVSDGIAAGNTEVDDLLKVGDWQKLAALPAEMVLRQLQQHVGDGPTVAETAVDAQTAFVKGLQDALQTWQRETARALGGAAFSNPFGDSAWVELLKPWQQWLSANMGAATGGRSK